MAFVNKSRKADLVCLNHDFGESPNKNTSKPELKELILASERYEEKEAKEYLEAIASKKQALEDKLCKLDKASVSVGVKLVHALVDSEVKFPLVYVPLGIITGGQVNVMHQQVLCALEEVLVKDVLLTPDFLNMFGGSRSEGNLLAQNSPELSSSSGNLDETEITSGNLQEKAQDNIILQESQRDIT
ncbi:hypothetical protein AVEN_22865-1 [Araneus ventricosus]|uniref:Uncharacterized protein n=1 Tax=Araneus ventricosus TaxID=182803 RepID=A0A4Y2IVE6_ARAVE|nr:hypothetical protein AVEN_22865-1 [Araneus ventricosus]